jgi:hypothetical protein
MDLRSGQPTASMRMYMRRRRPTGPTMHGAIHGSRCPRCQQLGTVIHQIRRRPHRPSRGPARRPTALLDRLPAGSGYLSTCPCACKAEPVRGWSPRASHPAQPFFWILARRPDGTPTPWHARGFASSFYCFRDVIVPELDSTLSTFFFSEPSALTHTYIHPLL